MQHPSLDVIAQHLSEQLRCEQEDLCHQSLLGSGSEKYDGPLKVITMEKEVQASLMHHWRFGQSEPDVVGAYCSSVPHEPFHRFLFQLLSVAPLESPPGRPPRAGLVASGLFTISLKGGS